MKKMFKFIPLVMAPALALMACANANVDVTNGDQQDAIVDNSNGVTTYTVTVDFNGGKVGDDSIKTYSVRKGTLYKYFKTKLPSSVGEGGITYPDHTLAGYTLEKDSSTILTDTYAFNNDTTLYAKYDPVTPGTTYTITWKNDGGTTLATEQYHKSELPSYKGEEPTPEHPTPGTSYNFIGWEPAITIVNSDQTYTAKYESVSSVYTITFDAAGGSAVAAKTVDAGTIIETEPTSTREGYTFAHWYDGDKQIEFPYTVNGNKTFVAHWTANKVSITFNPDGGTWTGGGSDPKTIEVDYNKMPAPGDTLTKEGYTFIGWSPDLAPATENVTYKAQWKSTPAPKTYYTISFDADGGTSVDAQTVESGGQISTEPTTTKTGWDFVGWYDGANKVTFPYSVTATKTLKAHWDSGSNVHTITFHPENDGSTFTGTVRNGERLVAPDVPVREGFKFNGWFIAQTGGTQFDFSTVFSSETTITDLYAQWTNVTPTETFTVTFDTVGGTSVAAQTIDKGGKVTKPADPTKTGSTFGGWYKEATCTTAWDFSTDTVTNDTVIYAKWTVNKFDITFKTDGGTWSTGGTDDKTISTEYGAMPSPGTGVTVSKTGYTFTGWTPTLSPVTAAATYTAQWTTNDYVVTFYDEDGTTKLYEIPVKYNTKVNKPKDPTAPSGKVFDKWVTTQGGSTEFNFNNPITEATSVYASYKAETYHIRWFNADADRTLLDEDYVEAGVVPQYSEDETTPLAEPTLAPDLNHRYKFNGWSPVIFPADDDMSYYATYKYDDEINLTYASNVCPLEGELEFAATLNYGGKVMYSFGMVDPGVIYDNLMISIDGGTPYPIGDFSGEIELAESGKNFVIIIDVGSSSSIGHTAHNINMEVIL